MATLANIFGWFVGGKAYENSDARAAVPEVDPYALRKFPAEDLYFYVKEINNARVIRAADPQARTACWKLIATAAAAAVLLIGVLAPSAYGILAGYELEELRQEQGRLITARSGLELEEARLLSPARLEELAKIQEFVDPPSQRVVYIDGKPSLALNVKK